MRQTTRRAAVALALAIPVLLGVGAGTASAAPQTSILQVPVVTGLEIGPVSVPGGLIQTTPIKATVGERPGSVRFSAADIKPYYYQYNYRWMTVQWRNLSTGLNAYWFMTGLTRTGTRYILPVPDPNWIVVRR